MAHGKIISLFSPTLSPYWKVVILSDHPSPSPSPNLFIHLVLTVGRPLALLA
jgi:hypothetical protein